jgi:hypothetical protein
MLLKSAVKKSRGKTVTMILPGRLGRTPQPHFVTPAAPFRLFEDNAPQKLLHLIIRAPPYNQLIFLGEFFQSLPAAEVFAIGMDVGVKEKPRQGETFFPEHPQGINSAGGAADVEEDSHR